MNHPDHVALIRDGVVGAGPRWLELGAGDGTFTLALADVLGPSASIVAMDRDRQALERLLGRLADRFPRAAVETHAGDFTAGLPAGLFDGVLAANSLHYVRDARPVLAAIRSILRPGGRLVLVEYDADRGNQWVPFPISFARWRTLAPAAGFAPPVRLHRVPSRFLEAIYGASTTPVQHEG
jgi:SAM-dependent methyltransferase